MRTLNFITRSNGAFVFVYFQELAGRLASRRTILSNHDHHTVADPKLNRGVETVAVRKRVGTNRKIRMNNAEFKNVKTSPRKNPNESSFPRLLRQSQLVINYVTEQIQQN
jgi:hypothetical protein